jgi:hypothetical protein
MGAVIVTANRAVLGLAEGQSAEVELTKFIQAHLDAKLLRLDGDVAAEDLPVATLVQHTPSGAADPGDGAIDPDETVEDDEGGSDPDPPK